MNNAATNHPAALRRALLLDAAASGAMGVLLLLAAGPLEPLLGLPVSLLRWVSVVLVPFAAFLIWVAMRARASRGAVRTIIGANVLWTVGSVLLLLSGWVAPTRLGVLFVLAQAAAVAAFAYLEYDGLRRAWVSPQRSATAAERGSALPDGGPLREHVEAVTTARFGERNDQCLW